MRQRNNAEFAGGKEHYSYIDAKFLALVQDKVLL
jgi:hypothetical protein